MSSAAAKTLGKTAIVLIFIIVILAGALVGVLAGGLGQQVTTVTVTAGRQQVTTVTVTQPVERPTETFRLRMATFYLAGDPAFDVARTFARLVEIMSEGRVKIEVFQAGELGFPVTEIVDATARGVVEIAIFYTSYLAAQDPVFALAGAKTGPLSDPWELLLYVRAVEDIVNATFRKWGVVYVGPMIYGEPEILVFRSPIASLDDLKGKIMRASGLSAVFYSRLGAQTVMMPAGELYTALQLGTVDGLEWTDYAANYRLGFHEVAKHVIAPTKGYNLHSEAAIHAFLIVNPQVWGKLPEDLKTVIRTACYAAYWYGAELVSKLNREFRDKWIAAGAKIVELPERDLHRIVEVGVRIHVDYAKMSPEAKAYVQRISAFWRTMGYTEWASALEKALAAEGLT
ncbi:MAG: TRAP transporter substrate-binding protein DctP [Sulfolobales archaeon]|nr:TRAP transporter substrate-binding protein DctP [Sulfolobales archaeon]MDW8083060.1 TRAP transporter substrate-binding protein DctP [Sulfolobales archaeon]